MPWRPLSARRDLETREAYDALHEGVPPWLHASAQRWVKQALGDAPTEWTETLQTMEQLLRYPLDWRYGDQSALNTLLEEVSEGGSRALDILDGCLMLSSLFGGSQARKSLDSMLALGGSAWTVGEDEDGTACLHRRVDETVEQAAKEQMDQAGNAARHLRSSWHLVYGRNPDSSGAYREAVRAVEAAAKPVVLPKDRVATLGKMIRAMRDAPSKWTSDLGSVPVVADMMNELWTSQLDRHGTDDESVPLSVSREQAEAAVHLAVTLVHWFRNGHVRLA
jgi:hypothetical protein